VDDFAVGTAERGLTREACASTVAPVPAVALVLSAALCVLCASVVSCRSLFAWREDP
jgi:hypothetical protein